MRISMTTSLTHSFGLRHWVMARAKSHWRGGDEAEVGLEETQQKSDVNLMSSWRQG
jgi:hypothetical protein